MRCAHTHKHTHGRCVITPSPNLPPLHPSALSPHPPTSLSHLALHLIISIRLTQPQPSCHHTLPPQEDLVAHNTESTQCGVTRVQHKFLTYLSESGSTSWVGRKYCLCVFKHDTRTCTYIHIYTHAHTHAHTNAYTLWNLHRRHSEVRHLIGDMLCCPSSD